MFRFHRFLATAGFVALLFFAAQPAQGELAVSDVTGSGTLTRYLLPGDPFPSFADGGSTDTLSSFSVLADISYSGNTITFTPGTDFSTYIDFGSGISTFTLTNLNAQGDNWLGIASSTPGAVNTFVSSNEIIVDYAPIFANGGNGFIQLAPVPEPTSLAMFGIAMFGLSRRRRQR